MDQHLLLGKIAKHIFKFHRSRIYFNTFIRYDIDNYYELFHNARLMIIFTDIIYCIDKRTSVR